MKQQNGADIWDVEVRGFMAKICDMLEAPETDRLKWARDTRATIAAAERQRKQPQLSVIQGGKSA